MKANEDGYFGNGNMSAATDVAKAAGMIQRLEDIEAQRRGMTIAEVRSIVSRTLRIGPSTLANIRRGRRKSIKTDEMGKVRVALIGALQKQINALEHEIHIHLQTGTDHRDPDLAEAEASLDQARKIIERIVK